MKQKNIKDIISKLIEEIAPLDIIDKDKKFFNLLTELPFQEDEYLTGFHFNKGPSEYNNEYDYLQSSLDYDYEFIPKKINTSYTIGDLLNEIGLEFNLENYGKIVLNLVLFAFQKSSSEIFDFSCNYYFEPAFLLGHKFIEVPENLNHQIDPKVESLIQEIGELYESSYDFLKEKTAELILSRFALSSSQEPFYYNSIDIFTALILAKWLIILNPKKYDLYFDKLMEFLNSFLQIPTKKTANFNDFIKSRLSYILRDMENETKISLHFQLKDRLKQILDDDSTNENDFLEEMYISSVSPKEKKQILYVYSKRNKSILDLLITALEDPDGAIREYSFNHIQAKKISIRTSKKLVGLLSSNLWHVRHLAARTLDTASWEPTTEEEKILFLIGFNKFKELSKTTKKSVYVQYLFSLLDTESVEIRLETVRFLSKSNLKKVRDKFHDILSKEIKIVRKEIILGLSKIGNNQSITILLDYFQNETNIENKVLVIEGIDKISRKITPSESNMKKFDNVLLQCIKSQDSELRTSAGIVFVSREVLSDDVIAELEISLEIQNLDIKQGVSTILENFNWEPKNINKKIEYYAANQDWESIVKLNKREADDILISAYENTEVLEIKTCIIESMSVSTSLDILNFLFEAYLDNTVDYRIRNTACQSLVRMESENSFKKLNEVICDENIGERFRVQLINSIVMSNQTEYVPSLVNILKSKSEEVRTAAIIGLSKMQEMKQYLEIAVDLLKEEESFGIQRSIFNSLISARDERLDKIMLDHLGTYQMFNVIINIFEQQERMDKIIPKLKELLKDKESIPNLKDTIYKTLRKHKVYDTSKYLLPVFDSIPTNKRNSIIGDLNYIYTEYDIELAFKALNTNYGYQSQHLIKNLTKEIQRELFSKYKDKIHSVKIVQNLKGNEVIKKEKIIRFGDTEYFRGWEIELCNLNTEKYSEEEFIDLALKRRSPDLIGDLAREELGKLSSQKAIKQILDELPIPSYSKLSDVGELDKGSFLLSPYLKAVFALISNNQDFAMKHLKKHIIDSSGDKRRYYIPLLSAFNQVDVFPFILELIEEEFELIEQKSWKYIHQLIATLGVLGDNRAIDILIKLYPKVDGLGRIQQYIIVALGLLGDSEALPLLFEAYKQSKSEFTRKYALNAIARIDDGEGEKFLIETLMHSIEGTSNFSTVLQAISYSRSEKVIERVKTLLMDPHLIDKRYTILQTLQKHLNDNIIDILIELISKEEDSNRQYHLIKTLILSNNEKIIPTVFDYILAEKPSSNVVESIEKLGKFQTNEVVEFLLKLTNKDEEYKVRYAASKALRHAKIQSTAKHLVPLLEDEAIYIRKEAFLALCDLNEKTILPELKKIQDKRELVDLTFVNILIWNIENKITDVM